MTMLIDSIEINVSPDKAYSYLLRIFSSQEDYINWHKDHITCKWIKGKPFEVGSILYCEETLHGASHSMKMLCTTNIIGERIEYKLLFPMSIICPKGSFIIETKEKSCIFTATLSIRFGWLFQAFAKNRIKALIVHMKEEGENLKKILEKGE
jgi:hypothetical protein